MTANYENLKERLTDMSVLASTRTPADALQYIEELEAQLAEYKHVASVIDTQWAESQDEIANLKANLAKALKALDAIRLYSTDGNAHRQARTTLAELTGDKDE